MNTAVLFLIFNRPDTTERVFEVIRQARPARLYVAGDGPRSTVSGEAELCARTRKIIDKIDWECNVSTLFRENNLGCKIAVSEGINWFFEHEEEGIILEDDCLPHPDFFQFCESLLSHYREDERVMHIGGANFLDGKFVYDASYYFSNVHHIWGWATWRRAWKYYDVSMSLYDEFLKRGYLKSLYPETHYQEIWKSSFNRIKEGKLNTWDYQWTLAIWSQNGLGIVPAKNLVSNIGFTQSATHTTSSGSDTLADRPLEALGQLKHPRIMQRDYLAEKYTLDTYLIKGFQNKVKLKIKGFIS